MKLTDKEKKILLDKLFFIRNTSCYCGSSDWIASDTVFEIREFQGGGLVIGGQSSLLPVISVQCQKCGHTIFFNALALGLVQNKDEKR